MKTKQLPHTHSSSPPTEIHSRNSNQTFNKTNKKNKYKENHKNFIYLTVNFYGFSKRNESLVKIKEKLNNFFCKMYKIKRKTLLCCKMMKIFTN